MEKLKNRFYQGDLVTGMGDREIRAMPRRLPNEVASMQGSALA